MAVAWHRNPVLDPHAAVVDRDSVNERTFGVTVARRHPAYVYSINRNSCLMHKVERVEIQWYAYVGMHKLGRLLQPSMIAHTVCGNARLLIPERSRTCAVPLPGSVLCGRCHGEPPTFGTQGAGTKAGLTRSAAHVTLGCVVAGYPSALVLVLLCVLLLAGCVRLPHPVTMGRCADGMPVRVLFGVTCDTGTCTCRPDRWQAVVP